MTAEALKIDETSVRKLLGAASPDAALLYLYVFSGNAPEEAEAALRFSPSRLTMAEATLRQLGLWPEPRRTVIPTGERPAYSEQDVLDAVERDASFRGLYQELQRQLGRNLNIEELKIILGFIRYLGLSADVIQLLVSYCCERARQRGQERRPSLRTVEKEAYHWAENGIDTVEEAAAYIQKQNFRASRLHRIMEIVQIQGRSLTPAEEKIAQSWLERGFEDSVIAMAYERTCLNTGRMNWTYMNKILQHWASEGLTTAEAVKRGDSKASHRGASGELGQAELEAIQRVLREG